MMTNITNLETIEKYLAESLPYGRDGYAQVFLTYRTAKSL